MRSHPEWPRHSSDLEPNGTEVQKRSRPQPAEVLAQIPFVQLLMKGIQYARPGKVRFFSSVQSSKMHLQPFPTRGETEGALIMPAANLLAQSSKQHPKSMCYGVCRLMEENKNKGTAFGVRVIARFLDELRTPHCCRGTFRPMQISRGVFVRAARSHANARPALTRLA